MIISDKPSAPPKQLPSPPIIEPKKSHSVIVDNSKVPIDSLITHVSGIALKLITTDLLLIKIPPYTPKMLGNQVFNNNINFIRILKLDKLVLFHKTKIQKIKFLL